MTIQDSGAQQRRNGGRRSPQEKIWISEVSASWTVGALGLVLSCGSSGEEFMRNVAAELGEPAVEVGGGGSAPAALGRHQAALSGTLTDAQRRHYLRYYAPIIFKQAHEADASHLGYDWITNFHFDSDDSLSNNKRHWSVALDGFVQGARPEWELRPTLYTALIEYDDLARGTHSVTLLYHVYHAKQRGSIHDWERIEIRIDDVVGTPGRGEQLNYVVITRHSLHNAREFPHEDLNFMETPDGKHVMIWQAPWDGLLGTRKAELHFVEDSWASVSRRNLGNVGALVDINNAGRKPFHYVFVLEDDLDAVSYWQARGLTSRNARSLAAGRAFHDTPRFAQTKRLRYELQDIADLLPSHRDQSDWARPLRIALEDAVRGEEGRVEVPSGAQTFYYRALDDQDADEDRNGYVRKHWFWGVYRYALEGGSFYNELDPQPWRQHDYFAHNGTRCDGSVSDELSRCGVFLGRGQYTDWTEEGGFDGRWVQLFAD